MTSILHLTMGTNGLKLGGTLVTATAAELNYVDVTTIGTAQASKAVVLSAVKDVTGFNSLTATALTASAGIVATAAITAGTSFIIGSADLNEADMEKLDGITKWYGCSRKGCRLGCVQEHRYSWYGRLWCYHLNWCFHHGFFERWWHLGVWTQASRLMQSLSTLLS